MHCGQTLGTPVLWASYTRIFEQFEIKMLWQKDKPTETEMKRLLLFASGSGGVQPRYYDTLLSVGRALKLVCSGCRRSR